MPGEVYFASVWFQPNSYFGTVTTACSSELYNTCSPFGPVSVPVNNYSGHQIPKSGNAYAGFSLFNTGAISSREYIETSLSSTLHVGKTYCVQFFVSLADTSKYAISNIAAYFSTDSLLYNSSTYANIPVAPQIWNDTNDIITDKNNWSLISGQFIASGGEHFMTIGNFRDNTSTTSQNVGGSYSGAYYFFDDISVVCCDCDTVVPATELIIPTLLSSNDMFEIKGLPVNSTLFLFNSIGQFVFNTSNYDNKLNLINFSAGVYYYYLKLPNSSIYKGKFCIIK
ncbi:MAG: T9SS type B sorting domain-containing protein [Bacteroidia bacterium]